MAFRKKTHTQTHLFGVCVFFGVWGAFVWPLTRPTAFSASVRRSWNFLGTATSSCSSGNGSRSNMPTTCGREDPKISRNPPSWQKWVFPKIGVPQNGWFRMENPIKNGWFGGTTIFGNIQINVRNTWKTGEVATPMLNIWWNHIMNFRKLLRNETANINLPSKTAFFCCIYHQIKDVLEPSNLGADLQRLSISF